MSARKRWWTVVAKWTAGGSWIGHVRAVNVAGAIEAARQAADPDAPPDESTWWAEVVFPGRQTAEWVDD